MPVPSMVLIRLIVDCCASPLLVMDTSSNSRESGSKRMSSLRFEIRSIFFFTTLNPVLKKVISHSPGDVELILYCPSALVKTFSSIPFTWTTTISSGSPEKLKTVLLSHLIEGSVLAETVITLDSATTLSGQTLPISTSEGVQIAGARVIKTDILASNGVIHLIDKVFSP